MWDVRGKDAHAPLAWRFSLQDVRTQEQRGFPDLDALVAFLRRQTQHRDDA